MKKNKTKKLKIPKPAKSVKTHEPAWLAKHYPARYLAIALVVVLMVQALAFNFFPATAVASGISILDMSDSNSYNFVIGSIESAYNSAAQLMVDVNDFYTLAAIEMEFLLTGDNSDLFVVPNAIAEFYSAATDATLAILDGTDNSPFIALNGINEFYVRASKEMISVLDVSNADSNVGNVAGASISR